MSEELPSGWVTESLGTFIDRIEAGASFKCEERPPNADEIGVVKVSAVTWGEYDEDESKTCQDPDRIDLDLLVAPGDFLFSRANTINLVGTCVIAHQVTRRVMLSDKILRLRFSAIEPAWALHYLRSYSGRNHIERLATGNQESMRNIGQERVKSIPVPIAPVTEQRRIVAAIEQHLSDIDAGVSALKRALLNHKRYRTSILKDACEGKLVPTEAELARKEGRPYEGAGVLLERILTERRQRWEATRKTKYKPPAESNGADLPTLPEGWVWTTVETVGDVLLGRQRAPQYLTGKWFRPYLRVANVKDDALDFRDVESMDFEPEHFDKYQLRPGDILVSEGQSPDRVGESAIYQGGIDGLCFQKTLHRFRPVPSGPSAKFAQIVFRSHVKTGLFRKMASITTNIAHLTLEKFEAARFPLPPLAEQHRIVAEVDRLLSVADETEAAIRAQLARAERLRQSVLKRAFEGKLVPQDPNDEPASVMLERLRAKGVPVTDGATGDGRAGPAAAGRGRLRGAAPRGE